jgi:hypothetical protein
VRSPLAWFWPTSARLLRDRLANLLHRRIQKGLSEIGVIDDARQRQRTADCAP